MSEIIKQERVYTLTLTENEVRCLESVLEPLKDNSEETQYGIDKRAVLYAFFHSFNMNTGDK